MPESILAEVASVPTDPQFRSLVEESFDPLQQQAVQQAGSDAYNEVVASHKPYTFTSSVEEMKSNLILLLRRFWRFPFGAGTIRSLSDMWQHYITRLQGSETYGIQSRLDQLTDLPSAPLLVADRKISGVPEAVDGISLANLICNNSNIHEINDSNIGWTFSGTLSKIKSAFSAVTKVTLNCETIDFSNNDGWLVAGVTQLFMPYLKVMRNHYGWYNGYGFSGVSLESISLPEFEEYSCDHYGRLYADDSSIKYIDFPKFKKMQVAHGLYMFSNCSELLEVNVPEFSQIVYNGSWYTFITNCPKIQKVVVGKLAQGFPISGEHPNLIDFRIAEDYDISLGLGTWSPTLDSSNLQQFLSNFRSFIVLRLANRKTTTALTLTLSANVYNAVTGANSGWASQHTLAELGITDNDLTDLETELGITSATIYATWLDTYTGANGIHWNVNKAN